MTVRCRTARRTSHGLGKRRATRLVAAALTCALHHVASPPALAEAVRGRCIVVDSDAALDDFRAVAALAPMRRVAAIVVTEGIVRSSGGGRRYTPDARLTGWRTNAERLNGLLPAPVAASTRAADDVVAALRPHTAGCSSISLLVIGPWTSFTRYAAEVLERVDRIVAQGRPHRDEAGGQSAGFNCVYDAAACYAAFALLVGRQQRSDRQLRADWVDIPNGPEPCGSAEPGVDAKGEPLHAFRLTAEWVEELRQAGDHRRVRAGREAEVSKRSGDSRRTEQLLAQAGQVALVVADILRANPDGSRETSLWNDLAALYLLQPDLFVVRGGHLKPCVPAATIRTLLVRTIAG